MDEPFIQQITVGPLQVHTYLVACPQTLEGVVIDPGGKEERIIQLTRAAGVKVRYILNTYGHGDHTLGNQALKAARQCPVAMHAEDDDYFATDEDLRPWRGTRCPAAPIGLKCA